MASVTTAAIASMNSGRVLNEGVRRMLCHSDESRPASSQSMIAPTFAESSALRAAITSHTGERPIPLKLISSETFNTGVVNLAYWPAASISDGTYEDAKVHLPQPSRAEGT